VKPVQLKNPDITVDVQRAVTGWRVVPRVTALVRQAALRAISMSGVAVMPGAEIAVSLSDNIRVQAANLAWRAIDKPTNVLSFPGAPEDKISRSPFLGDVILALETVVQEAEHEQKTLDHHLSHLVVHGVLHCLGYDHMTTADAERMEKLETLILASLAIPDPYGAAELLETAHQ
jgi:probable rRNA maturation factor